MNPIGLGILGFAHGHVGTYCDRWRQTPELGVRLVAGWDRDAARLATATESRGIEKAASAAKLLARSDVAAVVIGAETAFHAELVEQAAVAGKAIILQKPLALTLAEADRIVAAVEKTKVPFTLAWQMRVDPHNVRVRELLAEGRFGRIYMLRRRHCLATQNMKDFDRSWHVQPELNRDIYADDAAHPMDFVYWLLGRPATVTTELGTLRNPRIPNDNGIAVFRYADGTFAEVSDSFAAVAGENTLEVICERGSIIGNYGDGVSGRASWPEGAIQLKWRLEGDAGWTASGLPDVAGQGDRIGGLAQPLAEFLHGRRPAIATAREGRDVLSMMLASFESAAQGRRIQIQYQD